MTRPCRLPRRLPSAARTSTAVMAILVGAGAAAWLGLSQPAQARPAGPNADDRPITLAVRLLMERQHLTKQRIDNTISERWLDGFVKSLDPRKLFFYQSDIDEFNQNRDALDDMIRRQDVSFAYKVFSRFLARVDERVATALAQVDATHDFTINEEMVRDRDLLTHPRSPEEAAERWRKQVKLDLMTQIADEVEMEEAKTKLRRRYSSLGKRWQQTSDDELLELYLTSMTSAFDPHSSYLSPSTLENFEIMMRLELDGIGAELRSIDGYTEVSRVVPGGAADRAGDLKKGDQIIGVGQGTSGEVADVVDLKLNDVVKQIRGKRGTIVRLLVKPVDNPNSTEVYTITRDRIELKDQEARSAVVETGGEILPGVLKPNGQPYRIGVINLPSFYLDMSAAREGRQGRSTTRDVRRLLEEFNQQPIDLVVVDLRYNGGGAMVEAVNMTGLFIDKGPVVQVKDPSGQTRGLNDDDPGMVWSGPLAVLTNKFSASASEIFAGAIKDYGRGVVIGDTSTHGKGTVQQVFDIGERLFRFQAPKNYGALKMTIQQFYRPDGDSTQNRGVMADVTIPALTDHLDGIAESDLDYPVPFDRVRVLPHDRFSMIDPAITGQLQQLSADRVAASEDFAKDMKRIRQYEERKDRKTVTLNLEKFLAERKELDSDKETEKTLEKAIGSDRPVFATDDHYNLETLLVGIDYLRMLGANKLAVAR